MSNDITAIIDNQAIAANIDQTAIAVDFGGGVINVSGLDAHYSMDFDFLSVVTVPHNLGKRPAISVLDTGGTQIEGEIEHTNLNTCIVRFGAETSGKIIAN